MNSVSQENNVYFVSDLFQAALLYARGKKLLRVKKDSFKSTFVFENRNECEAIIAAYWRKEALIDALAYAEAHCSLKTRLRQR